LFPPSSRFFSLFCLSRPLIRNALIPNRVQRGRLASSSFSTIAAEIVGAVRALIEFESRRIGDIRMM